VRPLPYLQAYPETTRAQVQTLLDQGRVAQWLMNKYPEGHGLLAELLGHAGLGQSMGEALVAAEAVYDGLDPDDASPHSLASVYHKLATVYLGVRLSAHLCAHLSVCVCVCVCWP
jgi:hypothetical protein